METYYKNISDYIFEQISQINCRMADSKARIARDLKNNNKVLFAYARPHVKSQEKILPKMMAFAFLPSKLLQGITHLHLSP